jgi:hypothetical protein
MEYALGYHIIIKINFSDQEFDFFTRIIKQNNSNSNERDANNFWQSNINKRNVPKRTRNIKHFATATIKQMDTILLKGLEPYILNDHPDRAESALANELYFKLHKIMDDAIAESKILNDPSLVYSVQET